jgi:hypothetical protein
MIPNITLSKALTDPALFGSVFAAPSFWTWRVVGKLIDGLPLIEPREIALFEECTGRAKTGLNLPSQCGVLHCAPIGASIRALVKALFVCCLVPIRSKQAS